MLDLRVAGDACFTYESSEEIDRLNADRLGAVWPKVQPKLLRLLEKRGLTKTQAEDVCQDVAVRALASGVEFHSADDLYRWAGQVARNLHIDLLRSVSRIACDDSVLVEMQADTDIEHEVERRLALATVLKHWLTLRPLDQAALLEGMYADGNEDRGEAVKLAVRRHRARQRLRLLAEGAFGWAAIAGALRKLRTAATTAPATALMTAPVAFLLAAPVIAPADHAHSAATTTQLARLVTHQETVRPAAKPAVRPAPARPVPPAAKPVVRPPAAKPPTVPTEVEADAPGASVTYRRDTEPPSENRVCVWVETTATVCAAPVAADLPAS